MSDQGPREIRITSTEGLASLIPRLIGYVPRNHFVALFFKEGRLMLTASVTLDRVVTKANLEDAFGAVARRADSAVLTAWHSDVMLAELALLIASAWCPVPSQSLAVDPDSIPSMPEDVQERVTAYGLTAATSRETMMEALDSADAATIDLVSELLIQVPKVRATAAELRLFVSEHLQDEPVDGTDAAFVLAALRDEPEILTGLWLSLDQTNADDQFGFWRQLVVASPRDDAAPALVMAGFSAWLSGNGAAANWALDRAARVGHYEHPLIVGLTHILQAAIEPTKWTAMRTQFGPL